VAGVTDERDDDECVQSVFSGSNLKENNAVRFRKGEFRGKQLLSNKIRLIKSTMIRWWHGAHGGEE
jgi:hypothetical protein